MIKKSRIYLQLLNLSVFIKACGFCLIEGQPIISKVVTSIGSIAYTVLAILWGMNAIKMNKAVLKELKKHMLYFILQVISLALFSLATAMYFVILPNYLKTWSQGLPYIEINAAMTILIVNVILIRLEGLE